MKRNHKIAKSQNQEIYRGVAAKETHPIPKIQKLLIEQLRYLVIYLGVT
jgi:hypothetical protein